MYVRHLETSLKNKQAYDAALKVNAKERLAKNAAYNKLNKARK